jgi:3',5'-cyclic AMP phosphodiesterase CpdA
MSTKRKSRSTSSRVSRGEGKAARQLTILHLSDLHFGKNHRFQADRAPSGGTPRGAGIPTMADKLTEDIRDGLPDAPVIVCVTGDLATQASYDELVQAEQFLRTLAETPINGKKLTMEAIFVVPGNHDVAYDKPTIEQRLQEWVAFYNRLYRPKSAFVAHADHHYDLVMLHDRTKSAGAYILTINSVLYVQEGTAEQDRGNVDDKQLKHIETMLKRIPKRELKDSIRIAMLHHHPILIPALAEAERNYDAIVNSGPLLELLRRYGFQVVLHGHKHNPHTFTDDTRPAFGDTTTMPLFIAAGGSLGSTDLPDGPKSSNTYNRIMIKVHPAAAQWRIRVQTRLLRVFANNGRRLPAYNWSWETIDEDDRSFFADARMPRPRVEPQVPTTVIDERAAEYARTRGNIAVVEVLPSMVPGQAYEARAWIVAHKRRPQDVPVLVRWSAGAKFGTTYNISAKDDQLFCAAFHYWDSMLLQATIEFKDGTSVQSYVYARMPATYPQE